jgi:hypothetical protein
MPDPRIDASQHESFQACACPECVAMCQHRPCWPTPADAQLLSGAGYADRLMLDWWFDRDKNKTIYLLTPAIVGREAGEAPAHPEGQCTFLDEAGLCRLHAPGLKPTEGRIALCGGRTPEGLHEQIARAWDDGEAQALIDRWEAHPPRGRRLLYGTTNSPTITRSSLGRPVASNTFRRRSVESKYQPTST